MIRLAIWFLSRFKPWFMEICIYTGILAVYFGIANILHYFWDSIDIAETTAGLVVLGFLIHLWARDTVLKKRIQEVIDTYEKDSINKIVDDKNLINYPILNGIISSVSHRLREEGVYMEQFGIDSESDIFKKIKEYIWDKYHHQKK